MLEYAARHPKLPTLVARVYKWIGQDAVRTSKVLDEIGKSPSAILIAMKVHCADMAKEWTDKKRVCQLFALTSLKNFGGSLLTETLRNDKKEGVKLVTDLRTTIKNFFVVSEGKFQLDRYYNHGFGALENIQLLFGIANSWQLPKITNLI